MKQAKQKPVVAILMGSDSDLEVMSEAEKVFDQFGVASQTRILSAHRTPKQTVDYVEKAEQSGLKIFIAGAGCAAHLAGIVAAHTTLPVIGVPLAASALNGIDALLATVQMPGGIPVASMAIGKAGAKNAALFAVSILSLSDARLAAKLKDYRKSMTEIVLKKDQDLRTR